MSETVEKVKEILNERSLALFAEIDHDGEAAKVGLALRPTKLLIFGNPKAGTALMQARQTAAIDLPLKLLVWEDTEGSVWVSLNTPAYLQERHGFPVELMQNIAGVGVIAAAAAG